MGPRDEREDDKRWGGARGVMLDGAAWLEGVRMGRCGVAEERRRVWCGVGWGGVMERQGLMWLMEHGDPAR